MGTLHSHIIRQFSLTAHQYASQKEDKKNEQPTKATDKKAAENTNRPRNTGKRESEHAPHHTSKNDGRKVSNKGGDREQIGQKADK